MTVRIAVVHEARADFITATELADRVLLEAIDWLDRDSLIHYREWLQMTDDVSHLTWKAIKGLAAENGIRAHGHFGGEPALPDAATARRAILLLKKVVPQLDAVVLVRDRDDHPERRDGLEQARREPHGIPIVVGLAVVERECWVLSGYEPIDPAESERLDSERRALGFDPRERSHELTACKDDRAKRSPKRVLAVLAGGAWERERLCWTEHPLSELRRRGAHNGLAAYLDEIWEHIAALIGGTSVR